MQFTKTMPKLLAVHHYEFNNGKYSTNRFSKYIVYSIRTIDYARIAKKATQA